MSNILWFKDLTIKDIDKVGGKGASLGELFSVVPIPDGFCVSAQAYGEAVKDIQNSLMDALKIDIDDNKKLVQASDKIQSIIRALPMDKNLQEEIKSAYSQLGEGFVAVRSSATAEDLPTASFAGQQASFLNVIGSDNLITALKHCWASLFTARAIYYRVKNNFKHEDVLIAVVVQKMVNSQKAGVMFTVNPVTKNDGEILIEGNYGLGETVVSGQVTPDSYFIDKFSGSVNQKNISDKTWGLFRDENGGNVKRSISNPGDQLLDVGELRELTDLGVKIEQHYQKPQDIEWAIESGKVYILQARPITTL